MFLIVAAAAVVTPVAKAYYPVDLTVTSAWPDPFYPKPGYKVAFYAIVQNIGYYPVGYFEVRLLVDGQLFYREVIRYILYPFDFTQVKAFPSWYPAGGPHTLTWIVDPGNYIPEFRENNNELSASFRFQDGRIQDYKISLVVVQGTTERQIEITQGSTRHDSVILVRNSDNTPDPAGYSWLFLIPMASVFGTRFVKSHKKNGLAMSDANHGG